MPLLDSSILQPPLSKAALASAQTHMHEADKQAAEAAMNETTAGLAQLQPAAPNSRLSGSAVATVEPAVAVQWQWNPLAIDVDEIDAYNLLFNGNPQAQVQQPQPQQQQLKAQQQELCQCVATDGFHVAAPLHVASRRWETHVGAICFNLHLLYAMAAAAPAPSATTSVTPTPPAAATALATTPPTTPPDMELRKAIMAVKGRRADEANFLKWKIMVRNEWARQRKALKRKTTCVVVG